MAAAVASQATTWAGSVSSYSANAPSGATTGDFLIAVSWCDEDGAAASLTATGWTLLSASTGTGPGTADSVGFAKFWSRTATSASTYTFGGDTNSANGTTIAKITGHNPATPINAAVVWSHPTIASATNLIAPSVTPTLTGLMLSWWVEDGVTSAATITKPASMAGTSTNNAGFAVSLLAGESVSAGATGTRTAVANQAGGTALRGYLTASLVIGDAIAAAGTVAAVTAVAGNATIIPGTPPAAAAGTVAAVTATAGAVTPAYGVSGTVTAVTATAGTATNVRYAVSGTVAAVSATAGAVTSRMLVTGTCAATTTTAGTLTGRYQVAGTVAAVTGVAGSLVVTGKPGQGNEVLVLFDPDEVLTSGRVTFYQFDLLDEEENYVGTLQGVDSGDVTIDAYSAVKGTGKVTVFTDPAFRHLADGQPDFLGVQLNVLLGPTATSFGTSATLNVLTAGDADAADISLGDQVILTNSAGVLKESTVFTIVSRASAFGFTNLNYSPNSAVLNVAGDMMKAVDVTFTQTVDWLNVRIRPMIRIARLGGGDDPAGTLVPAGVYLCAAPVENWDATGLRRDVELVDKLSILDQDIASGSTSVITAYAAPTGANIITLVQGLIGETGERYPAIQPDSKVLSSPLLWDIGTSRLKIINDLLDAGGYFSLWCDGWGQYQATPYVQPSDRAPVYTSIAPFSDGPQSLMDPAWTRDRNIYDIPNRFLVVGQGDGTVAALTSTATNTDPNSPYSFAARGRWITHVEVGIEAATQTELDTIARARLSAATSVTNQITLSHIFLPDLHINSVVHFVNPDSGLDIFCYVVQTTIPFDPTKLCQTTMRVVA